MKTRRITGMTACACACAIAAIGLACAPGEPRPGGAPPAAPAVARPSSVPAADASATEAPATAQAVVASRVDVLVDRIRRAEPVASDMAGLDVAERDELARRIEALVADPAFTTPIRPVLDVLAKAWGPRAEMVVVRYLQHADASLRDHARAIIGAQGLSSAAVVLASVPKDADPDARAAAADAVTRAPDASAAAVERLCRLVPSMSDADWLCASARMRVGAAGARAALVRKTMAASASASPRDVVARLEWLAKELGQRGPWRDLAGQMQNMRGEPNVLCGDNFDGTGGGCTTVGHGPPIGDSFLRVVVRLYGFKVSFSLEARTFTQAQRGEVLRLLSALPVP